MLRVYVQHCACTAYYMWSVISHVFSTLYVWCEPYIISKEPCIVSKEPYIVSKEPYIVSCVLDVVCMVHVVISIVNVFFCSCAIMRIIACMQTHTYMHIFIVDVVIFIVSNIVLSIVHLLLCIIGYYCVMLCTIVYYCVLFFFSFFCVFCTIVCT